jgi:hypothetical protein
VLKVGATGKEEEEEDDDDVHLLHVWIQLDHHQAIFTK